MEGCGGRFRRSYVLGFAQLRMEGCGGEWFGVPVPRLFLCVGALHPIRRQCTSSVRVYRHVTGAPSHIGCSAPALVAVVVVAGDVGVFCLGCLPGLGCLLLGSLWCLMLWFLRNVARNSPTCISNIEITSLEFCGFLDTYETLGYPNYVRLLVDEAPPEGRWKSLRPATWERVTPKRLRPGNATGSASRHNAKSPLSPTELSNGPGPGTQRFAFPGPAGACQRRQVT